MTPEQREKAVAAITGTFIWNFKKGDNIIYNYEIVWELYAAKKKTIGGSSVRSKFNKPIMLALAAIIECVLDDFVNRVGQHVNDKVPNITPAQIDDFKTKKRDKFENYISAAKKHDIFGVKSDKLYEELSFLREERNRFHIQNTSHALDADEWAIFTEQNLKRAEVVFEQVIWRMMTRFYRGGGQKMKYMDFPLPWRISDR